MPVVRVEPCGARIELEGGETLFDAAYRLGIRWPTVCYGQARCTACRVSVLAGHDQLCEPETLELAALERIPARLRGDAPVRLACQLRARGDAVVEQRAVSLPPQPRSS
jgi:ferredoxin